MLENEKAKITELWKQGYGTTRIAKTLGLNMNTVKSYCRRNGLVGDRSQVLVEKNDEEISKPQCKCCGIFICQKSGRKKKIFCSDKCRMDWWNSHPELTENRTKKAFICQNCGKEFVDYGGRTRKFCSHSCYIDKRYRKSK